MNYFFFKGSDSVELCVFYIFQVFLCVLYWFFVNIKGMDFIIFFYILNEKVE